MKQFALFHEFRDQRRDFRDPVQTGKQLQQLVPPSFVFAQRILERHMAHLARGGARRISRQERKRIFRIILAFDQMEEDTLRHPQLLALACQIHGHAAIKGRDLLRESLIQLCERMAQPSCIDELRAIDKRDAVTQSAQRFRIWLHRDLFAAQLQIRLTGQLTLKRIRDLIQKQTGRIQPRRPRLKAQRIQRLPWRRCHARFPALDLIPIFIYCFIRRKALRGKPQPQFLLFHLHPSSVFLLLYRVIDACSI